jgi:hypothetical protein
MTMRAFDFIFMLTRNDRTVPDASAHVDVAIQAGLKHIGFKDVGVPFEDLKALADQIRAAGATTYLEVVSLDRESEIRSAKAAIELGIDNLLGGTHAEDVLPLIETCAMGYYPFAGEIAGHPSVLKGSIDDIRRSAERLVQHPRVSGLDLLAYRSGCDIEDLVASVCKAAGKPVIVAGSIDRPEQIALVHRCGAAGFTIGTSALDGKYPAETSALIDQLSAIIRDSGAVQR